MQVDVLVLYCSPQSLNENIVNCPAFAIHADLYALPFQRFRIQLTGKLTALIRVDDLGLAMSVDSLLYDLHTPFSRHDVTDAPAYHASACEGL